MADFPFHVAGGLIPSSPNALIAALEKSRDPGPLTCQPEVRPAGSRRRKLWEVPHKFHCPLVGVCFACDELRGLMLKVMHLPRDTTDFVLHTTAVGNCEERTALAELLHKTLEKRHQLTVRQFAQHKSPAALRAAWQQACREAAQIPAALWAVWTHPACDSKLEQDVYADIHMIQHQVAADTRAELKAVKRLEDDKAELQRQLEALRTETDLLRQEKAESALAFRREIGELRSELAAKEAWGLGMHNELLALRSALPDLAERQALVQQRDEVWHQNLQLKADVAERDKELLRLREFARDAEETFESFARDDEALTELPERDLSGKCVLCVGGRSGAVHSYREVVEQSGGRFLHHDGGLEESLHRIDGVIAAADVVICQAGCISHNAYWRVKDLCKRTGKPCMFVKSSGVSSFGRAIKAAGYEQHMRDES